MWALKSSSEQLSSGTHCQGSSAALAQPPDEAEEGWSHHLGRDGPAVVRVPWSAPALHGHPPISLPSHLPLRENQWQNRKKDVGVHDMISCP